MDDDDDDMSGNVSLGDMIRRQTSGLKKGIQKHEDALAAHSAELCSVSSALRGKVECTEHAREIAEARAVSQEALSLAREARADVSAHGPALRAEVLSIVRTELSTGMAAQHTVSTSLSEAIAELRRAASNREQRLADAELAARASATESADAFARLHERLSAAEARQAAATAAMETEVATLREALAASQRNEAAAKHDALLLRQAAEETAERVASLEASVALGAGLVGGAVADELRRIHGGASSSSSSSSSSSNDPAVSDRLTSKSSRQGGVHSLPQLSLLTRLF